MSVDYEKLQLVKQQYEKFKTTLDYSDSLKRKSFVNLIAKPILDKFVDKESISQDNLAALIEIFKENCTVPTFEEQLYRLKFDEFFSKEIIDIFKKTNLRGYTTAGRHVINLNGEKEHKDMRLKIIFNFLKDVSHSVLESEIREIILVFDSKEIPYLKYGIYSPWLHYMHPTICPIVNGPVVEFLKNKGFEPSSYTEAWDSLKEIKQFIGASEDYGIIDYFIVCDSKI